MPVALVADVQDALLMVMTDLQRLEGLLDHATANLLDRFNRADAALGTLEAPQTAELMRIRQNLNQAVTELQFHDMATQLLVHTGQVLKSCAWRLGAEVIELGPVNASIHKVDEHVAVADLQRLPALYADILRRLTD